MTLAFAQDMEDVLVPMTASVTRFMEVATVNPQVFVFPLIMMILPLVAQREYA